MKLGNFLRGRRKALNLSVKDVVDRLKGRGVEVSTKTIYSWEADHRQPDADTFLLLCQIYGVDSFSELNLNRPTLTLTDKLDILMEERNMNRKELAEASGIPYTTIINFYQKGCDNIKRSTLLRLANFFGVSLGYLADDSIEDVIYNNPETKKAPPISGEALALAQRYDSLDEHGREVLRLLAEKEYARMAAEAEAEAERCKIVELPSTRKMKKFLTPVSAGPGCYMFDDGYEEVEVPSDTLGDFILTVSGDSMEPYIHDGQDIYVSVGAEIHEGEVGIFLYDGSTYCKQYMESHGMIYLFSLNRNRSDADVIVDMREGKPVHYFGKVVMSKRPPLPRP